MNLSQSVIPYFYWRGAVAAAQVVLGIGRAEPPGALRPGRSGTGPKALAGTPPVSV
jgi:hypothetical protein